jgi:hypothetical protein
MKALLFSLVHAKSKDEELLSNCFHYAGRDGNG